MITLMFENDNGVMPSNYNCTDVRKFDCGIQVVMIGRIILIVFYTLVLLYSLFALIFFRTRSLLFTFIGSLIASTGVRILLFSLPLYYTWKLTQTAKWAVLLLDIVPEAVYFVSFFILLISYIFYVRALNTLFRRREMSLYSSSTLASEKETVLSNCKKYTVLGICVIFVLVSIATLTVNILWANDGSDEEGDDGKRETYDTDSPIADSIFIVTLAIIFEVILVAVTIKYPYKLKTALLTAVFPGIKAIVSTYEWYIWNLHRVAWLVLWVAYFFITELIPYTVFITMIVTKSYKKKRNVSVDRQLLIQYSE